MSLFSVICTRETSLVVVAKDADEALVVARMHLNQAFHDAIDKESTVVTGEVTSAVSLRRGWDADCVPYGGDGNSTISDYLNASGERKTPHRR